MIELRDTDRGGGKQMVPRKKIGSWILALTVATLTSPVLMFAQNAKSQKIPNLKLRLQPGKLVNGIPESFTFLFVNVGEDEVRMPRPSNCASDLGTIYLRVKLNHPPSNGIGGGCGGGYSGMSPTRDQAKYWKVLKPGESLKVSYSRSDLFSEQQAPGTYEFWAEYIPPDVPAYDARILTQEGIDFPKSRLVSPHLFFTRKPSSK